MREEKRSGKGVDYEVQGSKRQLGKLLSGEGMEGGTQNAYKSGNLMV